MFGETRFIPSEDYKAVPLEEQLATLKDLQDEGKVASVGLSNETAYGVTVAGRHAQCTLRLARLGGARECRHVAQ